MIMQNVYTIWQACTEKELEYYTQKREQWLFIESKTTEDFTSFFRLLPGFQILYNDCILL